MKPPPVKSFARTFIVPILLLVLMGIGSQGGAQSIDSKSQTLENGMTARGHLAYNIVHNLGKKGKGIWDGDDNPSGGQAEVSMAVDSTGKHVVVGFNDTRGFANNPINPSGFMYSDDGGVTFTDGGQLPAAATGSIGSTKFPEVLGDPEVKYLGGSNFIYFSILVKQISSTNTAQSMCFHRSTDFGHTWNGPFEITPATNPNGLFSGTAPQDAADKEFADVDPDTGRVIMSWSNFTPNFVEISSTFCDNIMAATPTWSKRSVLNVPQSGFETGCIPRFAGNGSKKAYVAWNQQFSFATGSGAVTDNILVANSGDNGATWSKPVPLHTTPFFGPDYILGNDRIHAFPWMAVDTSTGPNSGDVYVVYLDNANHDGGDIGFQKSTDGGKTWSSEIRLNARPGADRSQWFPNIAVDKSTGRILAGWDDQSPQTTGDLMEMMFTSSSDGGHTWARPSSITDRPFHAGYGNDTGQPNLGDYNGICAQNGHSFFAFAQNPVAINFTDGQPSNHMTFPDVAVKNLTTTPLGVRLGNPSFTNGRGSPNIDPGLTQSFTFPVTNYTTNTVDSPTTLTGVSGALSSATPGISILVGSSAYPNVSAGSTASNATKFVVKLSASFVLGTPIDFKLHVNSAQGGKDLPFRQSTGTPSTVTLLSENFEGVTPGALPANWIDSFVGGDSTSRWTTRKAALGDSTNGLFHLNSFNSNIGDQSVNEGMFSPDLIAPADTPWVTVDFDIAYDTEYETALNTLNFDGCILFIADTAPNDVFRDVLAEAYAEEFTTTFSGGSRMHYPKHFPRGRGAYLSDMSNWGGVSHGIEHVHLKLPGMAGREFRLLFQYTQDASSTGARTDPGKPLYGVVIDNVVVKALKAIPPANHAPVAKDNTYALLHDTVLNVAKPGVLSNDTDADGDTLYATAVSSPTHGILSMTGYGDFKYTPTAGFHGFDTFTYVAKDGIASSNIATAGLIVKSTTFGMGLSLTSVKGGSQNTTGVILLNAAAPVGGLKITLTSSSPGATVPASVTVPAGATSATFPITSHVVGANTNVTITAKFLTETNTAILLVKH